jgi:hypothetical protein
LEKEAEVADKVQVVRLEFEGAEGFHEVLVAMWWSKQ